MTNSAFEPPPLWDCPHEWMNVDLPYKRWSSISTCYGVPKDAPIIQKRQCLKCHGVECVPVGRLIR